MSEIPMPEKFSKLKEKPTKQEVDLIPAALWERDIRNMVQAAGEQGKKVKELMFRDLEKLTATVYKGREERLSAVMAELKGREYKSEEDLITTVAAKMYKFGKTNFTPRELEANIREYMLNGKEHIINDMLLYEVYKDALYLHVFPVSTLSTGEKIKLLRDGFKQLASQLKTDEQLKGVKTINGVSWIIAKNPGLFEKLGFTYDGEITEKEHQRDFAYEQRKIGKAHIEVDKFLELYD